MRTAWVGLAVVAMLGRVGADEDQDASVAVRAGKIITGAGAEIPNGVILIQDGKIVAVGKDLKIPWDAKVVDASDKVVMPGWIEAHTWRGVDRANELLPSVPYVSTFDSIDPVNPYFEDALRQGITTLYVSPGNQTLIGGRGVVVRPIGVTVEEMLVAKDLFVKISLLPRAGQNRMAHVAGLRREFDATLQYITELKEKREVKTGGGAKEPEMDRKRVPMVELLQGKTSAMIYCPDAVAVLRAIELAQRYKFKMRLVLGEDAWKAAKEIAAAKLEVVLDPQTVYWETDWEKHEEILRVVPTAFAAAGVKFAFQTDGSGFGSSSMWFQAATAVKYGLSREAAIQAGTLHAAQILGLGDRLGSIEMGKDANLQILTGDPLETLTWVETVLIEGRVVYERSKDAMLQRVLGKSK